MTFYVNNQRYTSSMWLRMASPQVSNCGWLCFRLCAFAAEDIISINHRAGLHGKLISYLRYANQATRFRATSTDPSALTFMSSIKKNDANYTSGFIVPVTLANNAKNRLDFCRCAS